MAEDKKQNEETFPMAFFLDTNILDSLPETLQSGELSSFMADSNQADVEVYLPDVVAREWVWHRVEKLLKNIKKVKEGLEYITTYVEKCPDFELPASLSLYESVLRISVQRIKKAGLRVQPPPKIDARRFVQQAVCKNPPFTDSNKGFKDAIVVSSMLKLLERWNYKTLVLVSGDKIFSAKKVKDRFEELKTKLLVVKDLLEAKNILSEKLDQTWKKYKAVLKEQFISCAKNQWSQISEAIVEHIKENGVSEYGITWTLGGKKQVPDGVSIIRIVSIEPLEIKDAHIGKEDNQIFNITLIVHTRLGLEIEETLYYPDIFSGRISMDGTKSQSISATTTKRSSREILVDTNVSIEGLVKRTSDNTLENFELLEISS